MAKDLIDAAENQQTTRTETVNTTLKVHAQALDEALDDNREQLIAQNMIKKGQSREEAQREIGILLELIGLFRELSFDISTTGGELKLELSIQTKT